VVFVKFIWEIRVEKELNRLVESFGNRLSELELYGLTEEEIALVEGQ